MVVERAARDGGSVAACKEAASAGGDGAGCLCGWLQREDLG
jgi:hypothetical protein